MATEVQPQVAATVVPQTQVSISVDTHLKGLFEQKDGNERKSFVEIVRHIRDVMTGDLKARRKVVIFTLTEGNKYTDGSANSMATYIFNLINREKETAERLSKKEITEEQAKDLNVFGRLERSEITVSQARNLAKAGKDNRGGGQTGGTETQKAADPLDAIITRLCAEYIALNSPPSEEQLFATISKGIAEMRASKLAKAAGTAQVPKGTFETANTPAQQQAAKVEAAQAQVSAPAPTQAPATKSKKA